MEVQQEAHRQGHHRADSGRYVEVVEAQYPFAGPRKILGSDHRNSPVLEEASTGAPGLNRRVVDIDFDFRSMVVAGCIVLAHVRKEFSPPILSHSRE